MHACLLQHMDKLDREKAFFEGPYPLLLSALTSDDVTVLLSGSDPKTSQVGLLANGCSAGIASCKHACVWEGPCPHWCKSVCSCVHLCTQTRRCVLHPPAAENVEAQVEFGAHQVILVRDTDAIDRLPEDLQTHNSKALIMPRELAQELMSQ